jgi:hypothetical protein
MRPGIFVLICHSVDGFSAGDMARLTHTQGTRRIGPLTLLTGGMTLEIAY